MAVSFLSNVDFKRNQLENVGKLELISPSGNTREIIFDDDLNLQLGTKVVVDEFDASSITTQLGNIAIIDLSSIDPDKPNGVIAFDYMKDDAGNVDNLINGIWFDGSDISVKSGRDIIFAACNSVPNPTMRLTDMQMVIRGIINVYHPINDEVKARTEILHGSISLYDDDDHEATCINASGNSWIGADLSIYGKLNASLAVFEDTIKSAEDGWEIQSDGTVKFTDISVESDTHASMQIRNGMINTDNWSISEAGIAEIPEKVKTTRIDTELITLEYGGSVGIDPAEEAALTTGIYGHLGDMKLYAKNKVLIYPSGVKDTHSLEISSSNMIYKGTTFKANTISAIVDIVTPKITIGSATYGMVLTADSNNGSSFMLENRTFLSTSGSTVNIGKGFDSVSIDNIINNDLLVNNSAVFHGGFTVGTSTNYGINSEGTANLYDITGRSVNVSSLAANSVTVGGSAVATKAYVDEVYSKVLENPDATINSITELLALIEANQSSLISRYATTIEGDGTTKSFAIEHMIGTNNIVISVYDSNGKVVYPDVRQTSIDTLSIDFGIAPAEGETYKVIAIG